jgi:tetratricopeptide (TPR) repeat protein
VVNGEDRARPAGSQLWLAAALAVVTGVYLVALRGGLVWDDHALIEESPAARSLAPASEYFLRMFWSNPEHAASPRFYRPLTALSYALEVRLFGLEPFHFHLTNLLAHLACCALVFQLARRAGSGPRAAALAAAAFGVLPRLGESVAWVSGRTDLLAGIGALSAWLLHRSGAGDGARRWAAAAALAAGLYCKEVAWAGGVAIAALELHRARAGAQDARRALRNLLPIAAAVALYAATRAVAWEHAGAAMRADASRPFADRPLFALQALGSYAVMLLDPLRPRLQIGAIGVVEWSRVLVGALAAAGAALGLLRLLRAADHRFAFAAAAFALAALAPVLHLVDVPVVAIAADRFLYLPAAGLAVLAASGAARLRGRAAAAAGLAAVLGVTVSGVAAARRAAVWGSDLSLFAHEAAHAPPLGFVAHAGLGEALFREGRCAEALPPLYEAQRRWRALRERYPYAAPTAEHVPANIGMCLVALGRHEEALPWLRGVAAANPRVPLHWFNLALASAQSLHFDEAERAARTALDLYPDYAIARAVLDVLPRTRRAWQGLPPPRPDEASPIVAARARVFETLDNRPRAAALWAAVARAPDAAPADLQRAARFLVAHGARDTALGALARLKAIPEQRDEALHLERALAARDS